MLVGVDDRMAAVTVAVTPIERAFAGTVWRRDEEGSGDPHIA